MWVFVQVQIIRYVPINASQFRLCACKAKSAKGHTALLVTVGADAAPQSAAELMRVGTDGKATVVDSATSFKCGPDATCGVATVTG